MKKFLIYLYVICLCTTNAYAQTQWPPVTQTSKPWTRWWWMGSAVDAKNVNVNLQKYAAAGIGGVEIVPIYGAKGFEQRYISYLSPKWMQMLDTTVASAHKLNMGVDVAIGTGWPIGGPQVSTQDAATKIVIQEYKISAKQNFTDRIIINDNKQIGINGVALSALMAYSDDGESVEITDKVSADGVLEWKPGSGNWQLFAAFTGKTLQKVKRAAPGGEGYTFDHFSSSAMSDYLKKFDTAYGKTAHGVRSFFNDSYELFKADWSPSFFDEFEKRRGYDLKKFLREFNSNDSADSVSRIKSDYRETMADLMLDNFSAKFSSWAHSKNALTTNQAHGSPANILDLYAAVDIAETETFGSSKFEIPGLRRDTESIQKVDPDPVMAKFASSAAHAVGHKLVSCETFTWLTEHFKTSWAQCKPEVENVFLSGVNHVFFHGTTYSPEDAAWPGWVFYASVNFVPSNSMWPHLKGLTDYIARCQSVLQAGRPDNELMIYFPISDVWNNPKGRDKPLRIHDIDDWLQPTSFYKNVKILQQQGYSMDFVSDKMIAATYVDVNGLHVSKEGGVYKTIIIPQTNVMPLSTLKAILKLAQDGAIVIFESLLLDVSGLQNLGLNRVEFRNILKQFSTTKSKEHIVGRGKVIIDNTIVESLKKNNIHPEGIARTGLQFIRRKDNKAIFYYIVNHTSATIDTVISLQSLKNTVVFLDPQTGQEGIVSIQKHGQPAIRLQLQSGESVIVKSLDKKPAIDAWRYKEATKETFTLGTKWKVSFTAGGPTLPAKKTIDVLSSWTDWGDTALQNFAGTAIYQTSFLLSKKTSDQYILNLGEVSESAKVWINGKEAGTAWSLPYELPVTQFLKTGSNDIRIEVVNLMANRIRFMDRNKIVWRSYHEINFVNNKYKDFDASNWDVEPSGLLGPVTISRVQLSK